MYRVAARWLILLLMVMNTIAHLHAQVSYQHFDANAGLPSNETYCAFEDKAGYMWFGTDHGVVKYNGYEFVTYTTSDGLTDNTVFLMQQDNAGRIWFLTYYGGICYYEKGKFKPHPMNDSITAICKNRIPTSWQMLDDMTMWIGQIQSGYIRIDKSEITRYAPTPTYLGPEGTCAEISMLELSNGKFVHSMFSSSKMQAVKNAEVSGQKSFLYNCWYNNEVSLNFNMIRLPNGDIATAIMDMLTIFTPKGQAGQLTWERDKNITNIKLLNNGEIWLINSNAPSYRVDISNGTPKFIDSICFNHFISDIYLDKHDNYWITTVDKGLYLLPNRQVKRYSSEFISETQKVEYITAHDSSLYIAMPGHSILKVSSGNPQLLKSRKKDPAAPAGLTFSNKGELITNIDSSLHLDKKGKWVLPEFYFLKLLRLDGGKLLAGGTGGFVVRHNFETEFNSQNLRFNKRVVDLAQLLPTKVIVATNSGLYYLNIKSGNYSLQEDSLLMGERTTACHVYSNRLYAVATRGKGVLLYKDEKPYFLNEANGLVSNLVEDVLLENDSTIWIATYQGLVRAKFNLENKNLLLKYNCYTTDDGLSSSQINVLEKYNEEIWIGTNEGLCHFKPGALPDSTTLVPLYFNSFFINNRPYNSDSFTLNYDQNNILIRFNALYYKAISGIRYKVRLNNERNWTYTSQNFIQYYDLAPGEYVFEVAAEDKYGRYASDIKELRFTIEPHFTQTSIFKGLIALGLLAVVALIVYLIFAYQRFKAQNVIKLLQSEFKALNYQINPHFIFNVLNSIQYYILRKDSDKAVHFLSSFSTLIRRIVSNSRQQYISVIEEVECLKDYLELEKLRLENKFDYELNIDSNVDIEQKTMLPMIIQPLVENSIWHGIVPLEERGKIIVDFKRDTDGALICTVEDNGVGINSTKLITKKEQNNLSLAMSNVKERLKIIGELNGSEWFINFMDKSELGNKERGTIVTIRFPLAK